jgi:hypothetical protein
MEGGVDYGSAAEKEQRKQVRRKRIEKRSVADSSKGDNNGDSNTNSSARTGQERVAESLVHLDRIKRKGLDEVTNVRVKSDEIEAKRRIEDERLRHERLGKLQHEALSSGECLNASSSYLELYRCNISHSSE